MRPSAPSIGIFLFSVILAILVYLNYFGIFSVPIISGNSFLVLSVAYIALVLGTVIRRL